MKPRDSPMRSSRLPTIGWRCPCMAPRRASTWERPPRSASMQARGPSSPPSRHFRQGVFVQIFAAEGPLARDIWTKTPAKPGTRKERGPTWWWTPAPVCLSIVWLGLLQPSACEAGPLWCAGGPVAAGDGAVDTCDYEAADDGEDPGAEVKECQV